MNPVIGTAGKVARYFINSKLTPLIIIASMLLGIAGAFLAGYFLTPFFGISTINQNNFSIPALLVSLAGAVILLAVVRMFNTRGRRRAH